jgi:murein L,D-transpeptidase YcbB/YkuD
MRLGHQGKRVAVLWKRLTGRDDRSRFDKELADRVKAFQKARALPIDGAVGPGTLAALNEPVEKIIERVEVGLERLRWAPRKLPARHLWVDLAAFTLTLREDESKELEMRVIIGDEGKATPVFHSKITYLVLNPDWVLPKSIALELLPKIQANPDYLRRNGFTVRSLKSEEDLDPGSVDWAALSEKTFPYRLIQAPGPANPLGKVKFMFPNEFAVYLHDTPADALFEARVRTFSHGCIRLEKPLELAERLLKSNSPAWTRSDLDGAIAKRKSVTVPLEHPIPVFLWYQTAWVDEASGALMLRPDVYGWDNKVRHELSRL